MPNEKPELIEEDPVGVLPLGTIAMSQVNSELGRPATQGINLNDGGVRTLAEAGAGQISMSQLQGKSNTFKATLFSSEANVNLFNWLTARGWDQVRPVEVTINAGVYIYSADELIGSPALTVNGSYPNGIQIINNGFIMGKGGGQGSNFTYGAGPAIKLESPITIANYGYIGGGGGYGGPYEYHSKKGKQGDYDLNGGGGAGGGNGGNYEGAPVTTIVGGAGGGLEGAGGNGNIGTATGSVPNVATGGGAGGGGGALFSGYKSNSSAGGGRSISNPYGGSGCSGDPSFVGGSGGSYNNAGGNGTQANASNCAGGGGGFGATGGNGWIDDASSGTERSVVGGAGGNAITLNGNAITWQSYGTIWGAIT